MLYKKWLLKAIIICNILALVIGAYAFQGVQQIAKSMAMQGEFTKQAHERIDILERELRIITKPAVSRGGLSAQVVEVIATAYTPYDDECSGQAADGRPAVPYRTIAVDPRVIPPGSRVYIPGFGIMDPHDTGGDIKGNRIDICVSTKQEAFSWGVRRIEIVIIR